MKLLCEFIEIKKLEIITESKDGKQNYKLKGPFLQAEVRNGNGRVYPKDVLSESVNVYNKEKIVSKRSMGELDHTKIPSITLERVSHLIESLEMHGNDGIGVAKLLDTPKGQIAKALVAEGVILGMSTRALGTIDEENIVQPDCSIVAVDIVADPSAPKAFVEAILENREWELGPDGQYVEIAIEKMKKNAARQFNEARAFDLMCQFIREIGA